MKLCSSCCKADAVIVDAHDATRSVKANEASSSLKSKDEDKRQESSLASSSSRELYYFDAVMDVPEIEEEEEMIEMRDFFDATSEKLKGELAVLLREDTVADDMLLESCYRDSASTIIASARCRGGSSVSVKSEEWGFPGSLNPRQLAAYQDFRSELQQRDAVYREMVYCYKEIEPEPYALCRFLRWSNFHPGKTLKFMDGIVERWQQAKKHNFYPDANVGCPLSVLLTQFPSLYSGYAKEGFPVCYFHAGNLSIEGIECVTDLERLPCFIWYTMLHNIKRIYAEAIARNPSLGRYARSVCFHSLFSCCCGLYLMLFLRCASGWNKLLS